MLKLIFMTFALWAISLRSARAEDGGKPCVLKETFKPFFEECNKELGYSEEDWKEAQNSGNQDKFDKKCYLSCAMKKIGLLGDDGKFDLVKGVDKIRALVKDNGKVQMVIDTFEKCGPLANAESVTDGNKGCERAYVYVKCAHEKD